jgi:uncharacterized 2Fe-2S/4Fe-4S cluster protein (DUF4445 family)
MLDKTKPSPSFTIRMQPVGRRATISAGMSLLHAAQVSGVELISLCGGVGACDSCKIRLVSGKLNPLTLEEQALFTPEELAAGYRLACQAIPLSDVIIDIPPESLTTPQRLQVEGMSVDVPVEPNVISIEVKLVPPTLNDLRSDTTRINDALAKDKSKSSKNQILRYAPLILRTLPARMRSQDWAARLAVRDNEVVGILTPTLDSNLPAPLIGLAVDIGTTKLASYLVDLADGRILSKAGAMNPQIAFGEDVVSRIAYANANADGANLLQTRLVDTLNTMIQEMCEELCQQGMIACGEHIVDAVVVGNTAMHHLFAGLPVAQLGTAPYVPAVSEALDIPVYLIGLKIAPGAYVHLPPNIAGYVGSDHVSMLMATDVPSMAADRTVIALDIGTNTEISLTHQGKILSCSCASGPAFEGAHIHDGMRAAPGAIERVQIAGDNVRIQTIGDQSPVGICGSGILDAVAEMLKVGILDHRGSIRHVHPAVRTDTPRGAFLLAGAAVSGHGRDVLVTRHDVNEIQLAKGAIRAGVEVLLRQAGLPSGPQGYNAINEFIVAGAFGTYISIESAVTVGMFPPLPRERFKQVGNAAGAGARQMLISKKRRSMAQVVVKDIEYIELSSNPLFLGEFSKAIFFNEQE